MFSQNPKDKTSDTHKKKLKQKSRQRKLVFREETRKLNAQSKQSCTPNNQCAEHIAALLRISQQTNQLNKDIIALNSTLQAIPTLHQQLIDDLNAAAEKLKTETLERDIEAFEIAEESPESTRDSKTNSEIAVFFLGANAHKVQTAIEQSEVSIISKANVFLSTIYEKAKEKFSEFEKQLAEFEKHITKHQHARDGFNRQLEMANNSFALFESFVVDMKMYNYPERPAEQKTVIEKHQNNLIKFSQNIETFNAWLADHKEKLSIVKKTLDDIKKHIKQKLSVETLAKLIDQSKSNWLPSWLAENDPRLFQTATTEVEVEFSASNVTWPSFLQFVQQRLQSSTTQVNQFKQYSDEKIAEQCAKNFKFEEKNKKHTQTLKAILEFTYKNNRDFYEKTQSICTESGTSILTKHEKISKLVKIRKEIVFKMLLNLVPLDSGLIPLIENFILSNLRGGIKVLKNMSALLEQENVDRKSRLNEKIAKFLEANPIHNDPTMIEQTLRSFKGYKLSINPVLDSKKLDEFETALERASKDLLQRKSSPDLLYQFASISTPTPSPSPKDPFEDPSSLQLSKYARDCFQKDNNTLLETIKCLCDTNQPICYGEIRDLIDTLRNDDYITPTTGHAMYRLPDIWEGVSLKRQVLVGLPHENKTDAVDIADPNIKAEIKQGFFEAGLRPQFIEAALKSLPTFKNELAVEEHLPRAGGF